MTAATASIALPEQLTLQVAAQTLQSLQQALRQAGPEVVLDAAALRVFDSSAVAVLLELRNCLAPEGRSLRVVHMPERLRSLVAMYGVQELLPA